MSLTFPNETSTYRAARDQLTAAEVKLRQQIEAVAAQRRALPPGGELPADYEFRDLDDRPVPMSSLFGEKNTLLVYSLMYDPYADAPCPMCVSMLDGLAGQANHIDQRAAFVVVAAAPASKLKELSNNRGWQDLKLYSAAHNAYQRTYHGETGDGAQLPMMNVFRRQDGKIRHFWGSENFFAVKEGQPRHVDLLWPLWNVLDLTPDGRGNDWYPALSYGS